MSLTAKSALVTGAANRLGAEIARTLHENGANLIIHYRSSKHAAEALIEELNGSRTGSAVALGADLADLNQLERLAVDAIGAFGRLDILVNNASSFYATPLGEIDVEAWDDLVTSNQRAPLFLAQACRQALQQSSGCIINMVDIHATRPLRHYSTYCSAKAANRMLVRSLALEMAPAVRVNGIAPGAILWPADDSGGNAAEQQALIEQIPLRRRGTARAITDTVMFLATNDYITGEVIRVDGGRMLN